MAPAAIQSGTPPQQQWQRIFIPITNFYLPADGVSVATSGVVYYMLFPKNVSGEGAWFKIPVPTDWIAGTDAYIYPVFSMNQNWLGRVRWGINYVPQLQGISIAAAAITMEGSIDADGTGVVLPPKSQWLTLGAGAAYVSKEDHFKMNDFTRLAHLECYWYRNSNSALDTHNADARLYGVVVMYQAFI